MTSGIPISILSKINTWAELFHSLYERLDPRTVRFSDAKRRSPRLMASLSLGAVLVIGAVSLAAANRESPKPSEALPLSNPEPAEPQTVAVPMSEPRYAATAKGNPAPKKHPRFYDPLYVFSEDPIENVSAYPLSDPPGIVVDLKGIAEPQGEAARFVGEDERIRAVKRRVTTEGLRYIIGIKTAVKRIELVREGSVVMVFPVS